jgi:hypothetical protein
VNVLHELGAMAREPQDDVLFDLMRSQVELVMQAAKKAKADGGKR